jgi:hypothetical protein
VARSSPDLSGVRLKLDRAEHHIETLRAEIEAFRQREPKPFGFRTEEWPRQDGSIEYVLYAVVREYPPREWALIIGDAVQNIRSALEHLAYELSTPTGRRRGTQFPIFKEERLFKERGEPKIATITGDERKLIERVQPYNAEKIPANDPLAILNKLSNLDKHRLLVTTVAAVSERETWVGSDHAETLFTFIETGPVKHDAKIVVLTAAPKDPSVKMNVHPKADLEVHVADTGIVGYRIEAVSLLGMLHYHVQWAVIEMGLGHGFMPPHWTEREPAPQEGG